MKGIANVLASKGRGGDSMLVHMTPGEVHALNGIANLQGDSLTINPDTGLPEANLIKKLLPSLAAAAAAYFLPGVSFAPGIAAGLTSKLTGGSTGDALMSGLSGQLSGASTANGMASFLGAPPIAGATSGLGALGSLFGGADSATTAANALAPAATLAAAPPPALLGAAQNIDPDTMAAVTSGAAIPRVGGGSLMAQMGANAPAQMGANAPAQVGIGAIPAPPPTPEVMDIIASKSALPQLGDTPKGLINKLNDALPSIDAFYKDGKPTWAGLGLAGAGAAGLGYLGDRKTRAQKLQDEADARNRFYAYNRVAQERSDLEESRVNPHSANSYYRTFKAAAGGSIGDYPNRVPEREVIHDTLGTMGTEPSVDPFTGLQSMAGGGIAGHPRYLSGGGDGMSDSIPAHIDGKHPAALATSEFVIPADVVSHLGNGSSEAGAKQLYAMMNRVRKARTGSPKQGKQIDARKLMAA